MAASLFSQMGCLYTCLTLTVVPCSGMPFDMAKKTVSWFIGLSIQTQLRLLLLAMLTPTIVIVFSSTLHKRTEIISRTRADLRRLAELLVDKQQDVVFSTQQLGNELAKCPEIKSRNKTVLSKLLTDRTASVPFYAGVVIADRHGTVIASLSSQEQHTSIADRKSFQNAKASRLFSSGGYTAHGLPNRTFISFAYPLVATDGSFDGVIDFELSRNIFTSYIENSFIPGEANFTLVDHQGVILYSRLYSGLEGVRDNSENFTRMQKGYEGGELFQGVSNDGQSRMFFFRKIGLEYEKQPYLYVRVNKLANDVTATEERTLLLESLAVIAAVLAAFYLVSFIGKRSIADRLEIVKDASDRFATGNMAIRVSQDVAGGEIGRLAASFDQMADQLEQRVTHAEALIAALSFEKSKFESLYQLSLKHEEPEQQIKNFCLEEAVRTTGSSIGYIFFLNDEETELTLHAWSRQVMDACHIDDKQTVYAVSETGLWGEAVRQRQPVITNDYTAPHPMKKGCPEGHVPITRHMNIPLIVNKKIVLIAGVGNKESDYTNDDVQILTLIMDSMFKLLEKKRSVEDRLSNERILKTLLNATVDAMFLLAPDGIIEIANENLGQRFAASPESLRGKNIFACLPPELAVYRRPFFEQAVRTQKTVTFEDSQDGADYAHTIVPVIDGTGVVTHLAVHCMDISVLKRVERELLASNQKLQNLNMSIEQAREDERHYLARELHDQMGQALTGMSLDLNWLITRLDQRLSNELNDHLVSMHITLDTLVAMVQSISARLSPPLLENLGLASAISHYAQDFERKSGTQCHLMLDEDAGFGFDAGESLAIFRVVQEALTNIARHADAGEVAISLCDTGRSVVLEVADNGTGCTEEQLNASEAFGVIGMRERARQCRGTISFQSNTPHGTIVRLEIPRMPGEK
jgi:signal transduction histidine kinase/HAMP domain-containing protein